MKLSTMRVPAVTRAVGATPGPKLSASTLPLIRVSRAPSSTWIDCSLLWVKLGGVFPVWSVPMKLPTIRLPAVAVVCETSTPAAALPEITLRSPGPVPPIRFCADAEVDVDAHAHGCASAVVPTG